LHSRFDRALLGTYLRPEWPRVLLLGLLLFTGIGLQLANPQIARTFIDRAQAGQPLQELIWIALMFLGAALLTQAAEIAETWVAEDLGWRATNALRADLTPCWCCCSWRTGASAGCWPPSPWVRWSS
jgi:ABC-type multidrug transport system fused ATPase/permease subunit